VEIIVIPAVSFAALAPEIVLLLTGIAVMLLSAMAPDFSRQHASHLTLAGVIVALVALPLASGDASLYAGMLTLDSYGFFFRAVFIVVAGAAVLLSSGYLTLHGIQRGEYYALLMFAVVGMMSMVTSHELLVIFIGIEILSVGLYVMAGFQRENVYSVEASVKYFLLGAFSTSFFLMGIALVYGATGSTFLPVVAERIASGALAEPSYIGPGLALLIVGFLFKISAFPFHMWTPDVYQGAPTPVTAFMSVGPKMAAFAALVRVLWSGFPAMSPDWSRIAVAVAAATMLIGNLTALRQNNIKRMLAYSSIAHAGYLMMGIVTADSRGLAGIMVYLVAYAAMNFAAFGAIVALGSENQELVDIDRYGGIGFRHPFIGAILALSLLSLAGIPPTAGFMGKFLIFKAALQAGHTGLVVFAVLNSALSLYYYLRPVVYCYMKPATEEARIPAVSYPVLIVAAAAAFVILYVGVMPAGLLRSVEFSLSSLYRLASL